MSVENSIPPAYVFDDHLMAFMHELRAPLTSLTIGVDALMHDLKEPREQETAAVLHGMRRSLRWLQEMTDNLGMLNLLDSRSFELSQGTVVILGCLQTALAIVQPSLDQRSQTIQVECAARTRVWGDRRRIEHILINLLMNASKYGDPGTPVRVQVHRLGEWVCTRVENTGPGLDPCEQQEIFNRYTRGAAAVRTGARGLGLGLHIVKTLVERHGGRVGVESVPGQQTSFWFTLRAAAERLDDGDRYARGWRG